MTSLKSAIYSITFFNSLIAFEISVLRSFSRATISAILLFKESAAFLTSSLVIPKGCVAVRLTSVNKLAGIAFLI